MFKDHVSDADIEKHASEIAANGAHSFLTCIRSLSAVTWVLADYIHTVQVVRLTSATELCSR